MAPLDEAITGSADYVMDKTGSPFLATSTLLAPDIVGAIFGGNALRSVRTGPELEMGDIGGQGIGNQRGIFAGVQAKGADLDAQKAAQELQSRGFERGEIWEKTGWFEDVDGK